MDIKFRLSFAGREKSCGRGRTPDTLPGMYGRLQDFLQILGWGYQKRNCSGFWISCFAFYCLSCKILHFCFCKSRLTYISCIFKTNNNWHILRPIKGLWYYEPFHTLDKLKHYAIEDTALNWITSYLSNRYHCISVMLILRALSHLFKQ